MIATILLDKTNALLIKEGLGLLDSEFESTEIMDNISLEKERSRIKNIISDLNVKFNLV